MLATLAAATAWISDPDGMSVDRATAVLDLLMDGGLAPADGAALLGRWANRGETGAELAAVVRGLLKRCVQLPISGPSFDLCGTGGTGLTRYNVSTTVAFILAAIGVPVAKHGNKGSKRPNGSFDLLDALGVPYQLKPEALAKLKRETGVCFLFARQMHPTVAAVAPMRKLVQGRTVFNLAGPLANPCRPNRQLVGVANERTAVVVAGALAELGVTEAWVVRGDPGIDELSITGPTQLWRLHAGRLSSTVIADHHASGLQHEHLPGGDAPENARVFLDLLSGTHQSPLRDMVVLNAGAALACWRGEELSPAHLAAVAEVLAEGKVKRTFELHLRLAKELVAAG